MLAFVLTTGILQPARAGEQLTKDEVVATFIGKPWHGPNGAFLFRKDGSYVYERFGESRLRGPWRYEIESDGMLSSEYTNYTFYKTVNGYRYVHSRSGRYFSASPNQPSFTNE